MGEDQAFHVVKRLLGKGGKHMKRIEGLSSGAIVRIDGRRSLNQDDVADPLSLYISAPSRPVLDTAVDMVKALLRQVQNEYREFCVLHGKPVSDCCCDM